MCDAIVALALDADLVFLDDASPDGTGRILDELAGKHPRLSIIHRPGKSGIGSAHLHGIRYAYEQGYERLVTLDCDFTHSPSLISTFLRRSESADVVVGSRYVERDSLPGWTPIRKMLTAGGHLLTETLLGISEDATGAFRVYNLETVPKELFDLVKSRGYSFFFESLLIVSKNKFSIAEIPIRLPARSVGHSKMTLAEIRRSVTMLFELFVETRLHPGRFLLAREAARAPARTNSASTTKPSVPQARNGG